MWIMWILAHLSSARLVTRRKCEILSSKPTSTKLLTTISWAIKSWRTGSQTLPMELILPKCCSNAVNLPPLTRMWWKWRQAPDKVCFLSWENVSLTAPMWCLLQSMLKVVKLITASSGRMIIILTFISWILTSKFALIFTTTISVKKTALTWPISL